jgi:Fic family protein
MPKWNIHFNHQVDTDDRELIALHAHIESYRLSIMRIPLPPGKQREFNQINMIRQIKGTTGIEGNNLSEDQIRRVIESGQANKESEIEAENAHKTQLFIRNVVRKLGDDSIYITEDLIRKLHELNTSGLKSNRMNPGKYRTENVTAGDYTAPDYTEVPMLMSKFLEVINSNEMIKKITPLIRAVVAHFYLITIHPFSDGNGRTSRALEAYILYSHGYNVRGFYSLANYHYRHRDEYIEQLNKARFIDNGNLTPFVKYCLRAFLHELEGVQQSILDYVKLITFKDYVVEAVKFGEINNRQFNIMQFLLDGGVLYSEDYRNKRHSYVNQLYNNVTTKTAQRDLKKLIDLKLVIEYEKRIIPNVHLMDQFVE